MIAKRKNRLKKTKTLNDKQLFHTITNDGITGGIRAVHINDDKIHIGGAAELSTLNKTIGSEANTTHHKICKLN